MCFDPLLFQSICISTVALESVIISLNALHSSLFRHVRTHRSKFPSRSQRVNLLTIAVERLVLRFRNPLRSPFWMWLSRSPHISDHDHTSRRDDADNAVRFPRVQELCEVFQWLCEFLRRGGECRHVFDRLGHRRRRQNRRGTDERLSSNLFFDKTCARRATRRLLQYETSISSALSDNATIQETRTGLTFLASSVCCRQSTARFPKQHLRGWFVIRADQSFLLHPM